ncbi:hypothetical protein RchiOBHm_Chr6g0297031 [Rosa chinensis]|uniref:Uncharacterized protein n=1 Tax=Rosa chinensis TaxID=74649 RepID=A0A2P6PXK3_ROSCH|nr:hypothetical protein RchiOBHm_Chr6g0297031 [Rosa chinensis]
MVSNLQNPTGVEVVPQVVARPKTVPQVVDKLKTEANWFKPKKGSVFPAKRRLVKTMVFHFILNFVASGFCCIKEANQISLSNPKIPNSKKCDQNQIFPNLDEQLALHHG